MAEKCEICEQWFDSKKALREHEKQKHSKKLGGYSLGTALAPAVMATIFILLMLFGCLEPTANFSLITMTKQTASESDCLNNAQNDFMNACTQSKITNCSQIWNSTKVSYDETTQICSMQIPVEKNAEITKAI